LAAPTQHLEGTQVTLFSAEKILGDAHVKSFVLNEAGTTLKESIIHWSTTCDYSHIPASKIAGYFSFRAPIWKENDLYYTKAADDLIGVFAILSIFQKLRKKRSLPMIALLSRAEEVGFIGAIGHLELGWHKQAKRPIVCVSLETSRTLPGAEIGKGPVVRLGDRTTVFDPNYLQVLSQIATQKLPQSHQKRIMDGGSCEATAATLYGLRTIGISVPLGNYHNQNLEGGPESRGEAGCKSTAPEFVHEKDIHGLITLCEGLMDSGLPWNDPWKEKRKNLQKEFKKNRKR
jgi:hypothetical protein